MALSVGIIGLPNVGKSTLFNTLLKKRVASVASYPFTTVDPNIGVVTVPDDNLGKLADIVSREGRLRGGSVEIRPAIIKFIDIAGLVRGAAEGQGLGNQFLGHIRDTDVILHVLREFRDSNVSHEGPINPISDLDIVNTELILKDLETVEARISSLKPQMSKYSKEADIKSEAESLNKFAQALNEGKSLRRLDLSKEEKVLANELRLLTIKPVLYVLNVDEEDLGGSSDHREEFMDVIVKLSDRKPLAVCAKLEQDLPELSKYDREKYLKEVGVSGSAMKVDIVDELINACYDLLGLIKFYTIKGGKIVSSWSIEEGSSAVSAAEKIHTDLAKKFIKAEIINAEDLIKIGSWKKAKEAGKIRLEGRDYIISGGDVMEVKV